MFYRGSWFLAGWIYFAGMFLLGAVLPEWMGKENGVIENLQMLWLFAGLYACWQAPKRRLSGWDGSSRTLMRGGMIYFFLVIMREISWGRAFFWHADGRMYQYSEMGLYGQLVHPLVGVLIVVLLFCLWRGKVWQFLKQVKIPALDFILLLLFILMADVGEHRDVFFFHGEVCEELAEFGAYMMMWKLLRGALRRAEEKEI